MAMIALDTAQHVMSFCKLCKGRHTRLSCEHAVKKVIEYICTSGQTAPSATAIEGNMTGLIVNTGDSEDDIYLPPATGVIASVQISFRHHCMLLFAVPEHTHVM
jgi:hypothetical protein